MFLYQISIFPALSNPASWHQENPAQGRSGLETGYKEGPRQLRVEYGSEANWTSRNPKAFGGGSKDWAPNVSTEAGFSPKQLPTTQ